MKKRFIAFAAAVMAALCLTSCGGDRVIDLNSRQTTSFETVRLDSSETEETATASSVSSSKTTASKTAQSVKKAIGGNGSAGYVYTSSGKKTVNKNVGHDTVSWDGTKFYDHTPVKGSYGPKYTSSAPEDSHHGTPSVAVEEDKIRVTLTVECYNALKAGNEIAQAIADLSGYVAGTKNIQMEVKKDTSVYDLLRLRQGIVVQSSNGPTGRYVVAINSLSERAVNGKGGWCYFVNGKRPSSSSDRYPLSDGDKIEWRYTVTEGDLE